MLGHKRISRLSRHLPPLITLPRHGELPTRHRHPSAVRGVPPGCSWAGCSGAMGTQGWAAPVLPMWVPMSWGTQSYRCLEPRGPLEVGCPRWGDRAASAIGMDGLQSICSLLCAYTHTHTELALRLMRGVQSLAQLPGKGHKGFGADASRHCLLPGIGHGGLGGSWEAEGPGLTCGPRPSGHPQGPPQGT